jgi:hypothetical protein
MRLRLGSGILSGLLLGSGLASADAPAGGKVATAPCAPEIWMRGRSILSGERLVAVQWWGNDEGDALDLHALYVVWGMSTPPNPYNLPSLAYDYVVADRLTLGASAGAISGNKEGSAAILGIRGGYFVPMSDGVSLWGRAGLGYFATYPGGNSAGNVTGVFVSLAPEFVVALGSTFSLTFGVTADIPLTGRRRVRDLLDGGYKVESAKWAVVALMMGALVEF